MRLRHEVPREGVLALARVIAAHGEAHAAQLGHRRSVSRADDLLRLRQGYRPRADVSGDARDEDERAVARPGLDSLGVVADARELAGLGVERVVRHGKLPRRFRGSEVTRGSVFLKNIEALRELSSIFSALLLLTSCSVFAASSHSSEPLARDCLGRPGFRFTGVLSTTSSRVPLGLKMGSSSSSPSTSKSTSSSCASVGEAGAGRRRFLLHEAGPVPLRPAPRPLHGNAVHRRHRRHRRGRGRVRVRVRVVGSRRGRRDHGRDGNVVVVRTEMPDDRADVLHDSRRQVQHVLERAVGEPRALRAGRRLALGARTLRPAAGSLAPGIIRGGGAPPRVPPLRAPPKGRRARSLPRPPAATREGSVARSWAADRVPASSRLRPRRVFRGGAFVATFLVFSAFSPGVLFLEPFGRPRPRFSGWLAGRGAGPGAGAAGDAATGAGAGADGADPSALSFARRFKSAGRGSAPTSPFRSDRPVRLQLPLPLPLALVGAGPPGVGCLPPSTTCAARPLTVVSPGCCGLR